MGLCTEAYLFCFHNYHDKDMRGVTHESQDKGECHMKHSSVTPVTPEKANQDQLTKPTHPGEAGARPVRSSPAQPGPEPGLSDS